MIAKAPDSPPPPEPSRRWLRRVGIVLAAVVVAGYVSNALTLRQCERDVAEWLSQKVMKGHEFVIHAKDETPHLRELLDSVGAKYRIATSTLSDSMDWGPRGAVGPSSMPIPYIVSVEWEWEYEGEFGNGGVRRFLCLFGFSFSLGDRVFWST